MRSSTDKSIGVTAKRIVMRTGLTTLLLAMLLTINSQGQTPTNSATAAPPVAAETGYFIKLKVKVGKNAEFEKAVRDMMVGVRANEPDNVYCDLFHVPDDPQTYIILERYKTKEASKAHGDSAYIKKLGATLRNNDLLDGPPDVEPLVFMHSK